jgi:hypothetical protein
MQRKAPEPKKQEMESTIRDFGVKLSDEKRAELRRELESQKEKFVAIERIHGKDVDLDLSR